MRICSVEGCDKRHFGRGFCRTHYAKWAKYKNPLFIKEVQNHNRSPICTIEGCNSKHEAMGFCHMHYRRFKKSGDPLFKKIEFHGMVHSSEYRIWSGIKTRCLNPNSDAYKNYGARGITICDRWKNSFINFYEDMGDRPFPEAQIDREENDKGYYKDNCRWVTAKVNANNRRPRRTV